MENYLENRYNVLFIPGQQLSLDETLIWAYSRIKFKVHVVTKAAGYGIKLYVITDAVTVYILKVVIHTGKSTYYATLDQQEKKKTVQVVEQLVEPHLLGPTKQSMSTVSTRLWIYSSCWQIRIFT
jgi:hypothetical protein